MGMCPVPKRYTLSQRCFLISPMTTLPLQSCEILILISASFKHLLRVNIKFANMAIHVSDSECTSTKPSINTRLDSLLRLQEGGTTYFDKMQIYDTDQPDNRLALYCYIGETRNVIYYSDWNDICVLVSRFKNLESLHIVALYTTDILTNRKDNSSGELNCYTSYPATMT